MEIEHESIVNGTMHLVRPKGKLDVFSFGDLKTFFEGLRKEEKGAKIAVDMSEAEYVASSGWSVLLGWRKLMRLSGGSLVLCSLRADVLRVYESMKITKLLPAFVDSDAAVQFLTEEAPTNFTDDPEA